MQQPPLPTRATGRRRSAVKEEDSASLSSGVPMDKRKTFEKSVYQNEKETHNIQLTRSKSILKNNAASEINESELSHRM